MLKRPVLRCKYFGDHGDSPSKAQQECGSPSRWRKAKKHYVCDSLVMKMRAIDIETEMKKYSLICEETGEPWEVPSDGKLEIKFQYEPRPPTELVLTNMSGLQSLIYLLLEQNNSLEILQLACVDFYFLTAQAQQIVEMTREKFQASGKDTIVDIFACLLPKIVDRENIRLFITTNLSTRQARLLHTNLGTCFQVLVGVPCGSYRLNLSNQNDRLCALRLAEVDAMEQSWLRGHSENEHIKLEQHYGRKYPKMVEVLKNRAAGGYSQSGNWTGFRNIFLNGRAIPPADFPKKFFEETLTQARQGNSSAQGVLQFDFSSPLRPPVDAKPISMGELGNICQRTGFVDKANSNNCVRGFRADSSSKPNRAPFSTVWSKLTNLKSAYGRHVECFRSKDLEAFGNEGMLDWIQSRQAKLDSTKLAALQEDLKSKSCELVYSEEAGVIRFMHVVKVRISHPVRGTSATLKCSGMWQDHIDMDKILLNTSKEHSLKSADKHRRHVRVLEKDAPVTFYAKIVPIEKGIPLWNLEVCAKRLVQTTLEHLDIETDDMRVVERCGYNEEIVSPFHPATLCKGDVDADGVRTCCINHYYECYVKGIPIVQPDTSDHQGRSRSWDWCLTEEADLEPFEDEPMSRRLIELRYLTGPIYLTAEQVIKICNHAYEHAIITGEDGLAAMIEILIICRTRLVDLENINTIIDSIISKTVSTPYGLIDSRKWIAEAPEQDIVARRQNINKISHRIGYLNFINIEHGVDLCYDLRLSRRDEAVMLLVLTKLAIDEGLKNWYDATFRRKEYDPLTRKPSDVVQGYLYEGPPAKWDEFNMGGKKKAEEEISEFEDPPGIPRDGIVSMDGYTILNKEEHHEATEIRKIMNRFLALSGCSRPKLPIFEIENESHLSCQFMGE